MSESSALRGQQTIEDEALHFIDVCRTLFGSELEETGPVSTTSLRDTLGVERMREDLTRLQREVALFESGRDLARQALSDAGFDVPAIKKEVTETG
ncbi:hypothetical protein EG68_06651 [Paragonimus skrjabini miyazakii]|uniref:Uncharacterized protein n=1 Tax=Paragonimus skrjabini miyazakii TaxID=59628 RepID=A0A8S9YHR4_9TREM|nr:hypothetical protein EG68_06651 [Paragonimus skrjabini miyazakii]